MIRMAFILLLHRAAAVAVFVADELAAIVAVPVAFGSDGSLGLDIAAVVAIPVALDAGPLIVVIVGSRRARAEAEGAEACR